MIAVIDYGMGNVRSVLNALEHLGARARLVADPQELASCTGVLLPGVGAFGDGMRALGDRGFAQALPQAVEQGQPLLGVCLGMQLLATRSYEHGDHEGLDLIGGEVVRLTPPDGLRVPHVGWNGVERRSESTLLGESGEQEPTFYFVHSFEFCPDDPGVVTGTADYGRPVTAVVERGNVLGTQFHPEKSQRDGLALLERFLQRC